MSFSNLPDDMIIHIFSKLPLTSIARCRQVCKSWCSLTTEVKGINSNPFILITGTHQAVLHTLNINDSLNPSSPLPSPFEIIDYPFFVNHQHHEEGHKVFQIEDSCNGLLCVRYGCELDSQFISEIHKGSTSNGIIVWNPSTQEFKTLPDEPIECTDGSFSTSKISYMLGCNRNMTDYKVIRTVQFLNGVIPWFPTEVKVYSSRSDSWRMIGENAIPAGKPHFIGRQHVYLNGAVHFITNSSSYILRPLYEIVAFDIEDERYHMLPGPCDVGDDETFLMDAEVVVLRGCLCVLYRADNGMELWIMKNYGLKSSWTKLFKTKNKTLCDTWCLKVLSLCQDGKVLCKDGNEDLILYDPEEDETQYLVNHLGYWCHAEVYMDNSMSL